MRERGMDGSGVIGMGTWYVVGGGDGNLVGCWDECVGGVGGAMIIMEWFVMMDLVIVLTSEVLMGLWLFWWRASTLGMWRDIVGGGHVDEMMLKMMVIVMS